MAAQESRIPPSPASSSSPGEAAMEVAGSSNTGRSNRKRSASDDDDSFFTSSGDSAGTLPPKMPTLSESEQESAEIDMAEEDDDWDDSNRPPGLIDWSKMSDLHPTPSQPPQPAATSPSNDLEWEFIDNSNIVPGSEFDRPLYRTARRRLPRRPEENWEEPVASQSSNSEQSDTMWEDD